MVFSLFFLITKDDDENERPRRFDGDNGVSRLAFDCKNKTKTN